MACRINACSHTFRCPQVVFTSVTALFAIAVYFHDINTEGYSKWWGVPLVSWLILAALLCPTIRIGDRAVDAVVKGLEMAATKLQLENVHYTLIGLSNALKYAPTRLLWVHPTSR